MTGNLKTNKFQLFPFSRKTHFNNESGHFFLSHNFLRQQKEGVIL